MSRRGWRHHRYNRRRIRNCLHRRWRLNVWIDCYRWWWLDGNRTVLLNTRTQRFYRAYENAVVELQNFLIFAVRNLPGNVKNSFSSSISLITYRKLNFYWVIKFYLSEETCPTIDSFGGIFHNVQPLKSRSEKILFSSAIIWAVYPREEVLFSVPKKGPTLEEGCCSDD